MEKMCFECELMRADNVYCPITIIKFAAQAHFQSHNIVLLIRYVSPVFTFNLK